MATKIFALLALLIALSVSGTTAVIIPQCSLASPTATIAQFLSPFTATGFEHPAVQAYRLQQTLAGSILQQPIAQLQQRSLAHLFVQILAAQQNQELLPTLSQVAMLNPATYLQQQHLPFNPQAVANAAAYLQQQQLQHILPVLSELAVANPITYPAAYLQLQQQFPFNQLDVAKAAAYLQQQQQLPINPLAVARLFL
uniref:Alpha-coixin 6 n=1 Tax=Coix lacryma-jobi TaxID=4505 RepID=C0L970_COILA|nr:alpha-coixin 6 [Coix lacryma-jobi]